MATRLGRLVGPAPATLALVVSACVGQAPPPPSTDNPGAAGASAGRSSGASAGTGGGKSGAGGGAVGGAAGTGRPPLPCTCQTCKMACPPSPDLPPVSGLPTTFAITRLFLGDVDRAGNASPMAWQSFGVALSGTIFKDAKSSIASHCKPRDGAKPSDVIVNGPNGVDNSFGKNIVPILLGLASDLDVRTQEGIALGAWSLLIDFPAFGPPDGFAGADAQVLPARGAADCSGKLVPPTTWATYPWRPVSTEVDATGAATATFHAGYMSDRVWTSSAHGTADDVVLPIVIYYGTHPLELRIHHAVVTARLSTDGTSLTEGNIGGVLVPGTLKYAIIKGFDGLFADPCTALSGGDGVGPLDQILAEDIMLDGTQDPTRTCDGISIGLGFEATRALRGAPVDPPVLANLPCACMANAAESDCLACCDDGDPGTWQQTLLTPPSAYFCDPMRCGGACATCQDASTSPSVACLHCIAQLASSAPCGDLGSYCDCLAACPSLPGGGAGGAAGTGGGGASARASGGNAGVGGQ